MQEVKAEVGFVSGINMGEGSGLLFPGGALGTLFRTGKSGHRLKRTPSVRVGFVPKTRLKPSHSSSWVTVGIFSQRPVFIPL